MKDEFDEIREDVHYFYIDDCLEIKSKMWCGFTIDRKRLGVNNCFFYTDDNKYIVLNNIDKIINKIKNIE